jgi:hypothetical protein
MCELYDFRTKITVETDAYLEARAAVTGEDKQTIVRNMLHAVALKETQEAIVMYQSLRAKGMVRAEEGKSGIAKGFPAQPHQC